MKAFTLKSLGAGLLLVSGMLMSSSALAAGGHGWGEFIQAGGSKMFLD